MSITSYGWSPSWDRLLSGVQPAGKMPARVSCAYGARYDLLCDDGEVPAVLAGRVPDVPVVGDWVLARPPADRGPAIIELVLPRSSAFSRRAPGVTTAEQVIAANVDVALIVMGLDGDYNLNRLERYISATYESGALPVIVLNKCDLESDLEMRRSEVETIALGAPVHVVSVRTRAGIAGLEQQLEPGSTAVLLGSSGVGKSSLINLMLGTELQPTNEVRAGDDRGRHTTTRRELILLPGGALVIDTPGMRELGVWRGDPDDSFSDIAALALGCRFRDCRHETEPGCAVRASLEAGELDERRFRSYEKLKREAAFLERRVNERAREEHRAMIKARSRAIRRIKKR